MIILIFNINNYINSTLIFTSSMITLIFNINNYINIHIVNDYINIQY